MWKKPKLIDKPVLSLVEGWFRTLPPDAQRAARSLVHLAEDRGTPVYLVGGPLRDLLLGRTSLDIDLVLGGDAITLGRELAASLGVRPRLHPAFGTATIPGDHWHLDIAAARRETYRRPGALPAVTAATVDEDLHRRDFTINAMALRLDGPDAGTLLDPVDGETDLHAGAIRILHERSFQDDATRILRAARYAARFGFSVEPATLAWLLRDTSWLHTISGARLHREFARIFREAEPELALSMLEATGALAAIHPALTFPEARVSALVWLRSAHPHGFAAACWPLLACASSPGEASGASARLALTKSQAESVEAMPRLKELANSLDSASTRGGELADMLGPFPPAALWAFAAAEAGQVRDRCLHYLTTLRHIRPVLRGDDVIALGVPRGPEVGDALRRLREAKLNGEVRTRRDEERLVEGLLAGAPAR